MATSEVMVMQHADSPQAAGGEFDRYWSADLVEELHSFGLIEVSGPDARTFLANLFTGDVRLISPELSQFTSWCDGKGRIMTTLWLFMRGDSFYVLLPKSLLPATLARMRQFLLRSKATITDASEELAIVGLSGPQIAKLAQSALGGELPATRGATRSLGECTIMALTDAPQPRWLLVGPSDEVAAIRARLPVEAPSAEPSVWSLLDILSGLPWLEAATSTEFVPQMLNLEALGGLCFTKGCYPGQEVVARLHYRGQLKRRLYLAYLDAGELPAPGSRLAGPATSESVGMVLASAKADAGRIALLAVIAIEHKEQGDIHLLDLTGPKLAFDEPFAAMPINP
jgi:folate-binding protein YgfZ